MFALALTGQLYIARVHFIIVSWIDSRVFLWDNNFTKITKGTFLVKIPQSDSLMGLDPWVDPSGHLHAPQEIDHRTLSVRRGDWSRCFKDRPVRTSIRWREIQPHGSYGDQPFNDVCAVPRTPPAQSPLDASARSSGRTRSVMYLFCGHVIRPQGTRRRELQRVTDGGALTYYTVPAERHPSAHDVGGPLTVREQRTKDGTRNQYVLDS